MKICKIYIKGFQQFQDVELDFTNPETGEPVEKVCFIGSNGTGKTILLNEIKNALNFVSRNGFGFENFGHIRPLTIFEFFTEKRFFYCIFSAHQVSQYCFFSEKKIINKNSLSSLKSGEDIAEFLTKIKNSINANHHEEMIEGISRKKTLFINSPAEAISNSSLLISDVPESSVNEALSLNKSFPTYALVSADKINEFWRILVYSLRKRAEDRDNYENLPDNLSKTKKLLIEEFDGMEPKILHYLNNVWNKVLDKAGLYFDVEGASNPYQLNDNLKAYIRLKSNGKHIPYNELSTGIRNYIFRIGHIFSLYFNREIDLGFLLVDEPENSLYPDFLFELTEIYQQIVLDKRGQNNTQMFFATHNPIIAAQFKPHERIILDWNEDGTVSARKGISPEGDDPNDILSNDFELKNLMGPEGRKMWEEYISLKKKLIKTSDDKEKSKLIHEIEKIGSLYNFS